MRRFARSLSRLSVMGLIRVYQVAISPFYSPCCRFHPTCSRYALDAVATHGALRGSAMALRRIVRCRPGVAHGYDPVEGRS